MSLYTQTERFFEHFISISLDLLILFKQHYVIQNNYFIFTENVLFRCIK